MNTSEKYYNRIMKDIRAGKRVSYSRAVRAHCLECMGFNYAEVRKCNLKDKCPLWPMRMGRNLTGREDFNFDSTVGRGAGRGMGKTKSKR